MSDAKRTPRRRVTREQLAEGQKVMDALVPRITAPRERPRDPVEYRILQRLGEHPDRLGPPPREGDEMGEGKQDEDERGA